MMVKDALKPLHPSAFREWADFRLMMARLANKRPIIEVRELATEVVQISSNMKRQPMYGLEDQLEEEFGFQFIGNDVYASDKFTAARWALFQEFATFWGIILNPFPPLILAQPQVFAYDIEHPRSTVSVASTSTAPTGLP